MQLPQSVRYHKRIEMNELIAKIQGDPTLTLMAIIAVVVFLVIVLTIIVSAMRVKSYKDRFWNSEIDNKEKAVHICQNRERVAGI